MRPVDNPPSRLTGAALEWEEVPPAAELTVREEQAASLLTCNDSPDIGFRWSINPYRGCQHGCSYCYARRTHEYLELGAGTDFDTHIFVKVNAPELLAAELRRPGWRREPIAIAGVTDAYQPLEATYRLTRRCLEVCCDAAQPVGIVTKGYLVVRDIDVLLELGRRSRVRVELSIPFADDDAARLVESNAPPPSRRFEALRRLREAGVPTGVLIAPVIPGLNDRAIPAILRRAAECGAQWAGMTPIRLPGSVGDVFLRRLRQSHPDAAARVEQRIRDLRGGRLNDPRFGHRLDGQGAYWESVRRLFETFARRLGLSDEPPWQCEDPPRPTVRQLPLFPGLD